MKSFYKIDYKIEMEFLLFTSSKYLKYCTERMILSKYKNLIRYKFENFDLSK